MKKKTMLISGFIVLVFVAIILILNSSFALENEASSTITVADSGLTWIYGSQILGGGTIQFHKKIASTELGDQKAVYCTEATMNMAATTCSYLSQISSGESYIVANGSSKDISDKDYFVTQIALWWWIRCYDSTTQTIPTTCKKSDSFTALNAFTLDFDNPENSVYTGSDNGTVTGGVVAEIATLLNKALAAETKLDTSTDVSISIDKSNTQLTKDGDYYKSDAIGVTATNISGKYVVSIASGAPQGTVITNTSGTSQTSFEANEKFIIQVPADNLTSNETVNIVVTANGNTITTGYEYDCSGDNQNLALAESTATSASDKATFGITINSVKISKVDVTTQKELPGAHLVVKNSAGEIIDEWVSTDEPHYITGLSAGDYILTETIAPDGYVLSTETQKFTITDGGDTPTVKMTNALTQLEISKQDATTSKELPGASLVLKDESGEVVEKWTSTDEPHKIYGLVPGTYTLTETIAPDGYVLSSETVKIKINDDGTADKVVMKNSKETTKAVEQVPTGDLPIILVVTLAVVSLAIIAFYYAKTKKKVS